jgi:hypothetical protein
MIRWLWAFVDRPLAQFDDSALFWAAVTCTRLSPRRGEHGEFATFIPSVGDACVKLQGVFEGGGAHLDLEFEDHAGAVELVRQLGGRIVRDDPPGRWSLVESPSGHAFCVTGWGGASRKPPPVWVGRLDPVAPNDASDTGNNRLDQVCIDIAPEAFDAEVAFWSALTGWAARPGRYPEFHYLDAPPQLSIRILFQRLGSSRPTSAHLDFACSDLPAVRAQHELLGARRVAEGPAWTVMRDPVGGVYCLTQRDPVTGRLPAP